MNIVILLGNITKDIETKTTSSGKEVASFSLAVRRDNENTDFIPCIAFGKTAELLSKYCSKGSKISVEGSLRQNTYTDKDGNKRTTYNVLVNKINLLSKKVEPEIENDPFKEMGNIVRQDNIEIEDSDLPF